MADRLIGLGDGSIKYQGTWSEMKDRPESILKFLASDTHDNSSDGSHTVDKTVESQRLKVEEAVSDLGRATGDISLYGTTPLTSTNPIRVLLIMITLPGYYLKSVGLRNFFILLACTSSYSFFVTFPQYWLQKWTEAPASHTMFYVGGYIILSLLAWTCTNGSMW